MQHAADRDYRALARERHCSRSDGESHSNAEENYSGRDEQPELPVCGAVDPAKRPEPRVYHIAEHYADRQLRELHGFEAAAQQRNLHGDKHAVHRYRRLTERQRREKAHDVWQARNRRRSELRLDREAYAERHQREAEA